MMEHVKEAFVLTYDCVTRPRAALAEIAKGQRLYEGALIWFLTILLSVISVFAQWENSSVLTFLAIYIGAGFFFLIRLVCLHGTSRILSGQGSIKGLAAALCFADVPMNLATLAESVVFLVPEELVHLFSAVAGIWAFVLSVMAIMTNYGLSPVRSVLAIILPVVILTGCIVLFFLYIAISVVNLVPGL